MGEGHPEAVLYHGDSRRMAELAESSIDLTVTSPPYWQIKDYGVAGQIGFGQSLHDYLADLARVWAECYRVGRDGSRMCVNIGDQFARATEFGRYRVIPLHAEIICQCAALGFDFLGSIIWRKKTTMNTSGGATVMGSYPYPPNGIVEIDYEHILLFKKPGPPRTVGPKTKERSAITLEEWKAWFSGHWDLGGARKTSHEAPFPEEIPRRLIRMFCYEGDVVLDPFMGTGTTAKAALDLGRSTVGYEINPKYVEIARDRLAPMSWLGMSTVRVVTARREEPLPLPGAVAPRIPDIAPVEERAAPEPPPLYTVVAAESDCSLQLGDGQRVRFSGLRVEDAAGAVAYLRDRVVRKRVFLRDAKLLENGIVEARVILKNRISVNGQLVKQGFAVALAADGAQADGEAAEGEPAEEGPAQRQPADGEPVDGQPADGEPGEDGSDAGEG